MKKLKFLIVEDEILIALDLQGGLLRAGHDVCGLVVSGEQAVLAAQKEKPDVILMDIRLLGTIDGIEGARQIGAFLPATIIFTTGYPDPDLKERALALKPAAYLIKPVDSWQINAILESIYTAEQKMVGDIFWCTRQEFNLLPKGYIIL